MSSDSTVHKVYRDSQASKQLGSKRPPKLAASDKLKSGKDEESAMQSEDEALAFLAQVLVEAYLEQKKHAKTR